MELMVKIYGDKPSKIGIKYIYEYQAVKAYEDLFTKGGGYVFSLKMEMVRNRINLSLTSEQTGWQMFYKDLEYKMEHLAKLRDHFRPGSDLQFVHVFSKANTLMIAKPFRSQRFLKLSSYEIIGAGN